MLLISEGFENWMGYRDPSMARLDALRDRTNFPINNSEPYGPHGGQSIINEGTNNSEPRYFANYVTRYHVL